jgi:OFA family oxalate/formate antiporter-like MFS transporter
MKNRWIQLFGSLIAMIMIANLQYGWTLFVQPLQQAHGWKLSGIQLGFTLFILFQTWVMPLEGWLIDRMGPRFFVSIAGVLCGFGWVSLAYVKTLTALYVFYAIAGVGAAFVYSGSIAAAVKWFPDRRGLASGIIAGGYGCGAALFIPVIAYLIRQYDYRVAFQYSGIFQGSVILLVAQILRNPDPDFRKAHAAAAAPKVQARRNTETFNTGDMLRTPHFYFLYAMFVMMAYGGLLVTAQAGPVSRAWHISPAALTLALTLNPIANGASRVFWGAVSDRIGRETTMSIAFFLQACCLLGIVRLGQYSEIFFTVTLVLTYFTWGEVFSLFPPTTADYFGVRHAASNYSFMYTAKGAASIVAGYLSAQSFEHFGNWSLPFYCSAGLALLSAVMAFGLRYAPLPRKAVPQAAVGGVPVTAGAGESD